jgi:hypothetical protein
MKTKSNYHTKTAPAFLMALALSCLVFSAQAQTGNPSIVGLWRVHFILDNGTESFQSFKQFHPDGLEMEVANVNAIPDSCNGTFKVRADGTVQLFHVGWLILDQNSPAGHFRETDIIRVSQDGNHYSGTWHERDFDANGNLVSEEGGTLKATRLTVP